jgi:hypothetical protein
MADTRIGGQSPSIPTPTTTNVTALEVPVSSIEDRRISTDNQAAANTALAQKMQATENKGQQNLSGQLIRHNLYQALPATAAGATTQASGSTQAAIRDWQESINKWRADNGQPLIKENGIASEETLKALREFQKHEGINENGFGPKTQKRLSTEVDIIALKNNPNTAADMRRLLGSEGFKKMPPDMQSDVISRLKQYESAGQRSSIGNLLNVIDQSGFANLPLSSKKLMLDTMAARPDDDRLATNLSRLSATDFGKLDETSQNFVLKRIQSYGGDRNKIISMMIIAGRTTSPPPGQPQIPLRNETLTRLMNYPPDTDQVENLVKVLGAPGFADLSEDLQTQILDGLPYRFDTGQLTPLGAENMMKLASAPNFEKLDRNKREEMMNTMARRPDNFRLADALRELAEDRRFQQDHRTWIQTLEKLDDSVW